MYSERGHFTLAHTDAAMRTARWRAEVNKHLGVDSEVAKDFGVRLGFRQAFFLAPDFGQNYLKIKKLTSTFEPTIGFYYHF